MNKLSNLKIRQKELRERLDAILAITERENRNELTTKEKNEWDFLKSDFDDVCDDIELLRRGKDFGLDNRDLPVNRRYLPESGSQGGVADSDLKGYSLMRAIRQLANNKPLDGLEAEMSQEMASRSGIASGGQEGRAIQVPLAVLAAAERRDLVVGTPTAGGNSVFTDAGSFIEILRDRLVLAKLGATVIGDLKGDVAFPRESAKSTAAWSSEVAAFNESSPTVDQVTLTPNRIGGFCEVSWQLIYQSSIQIEQWLRQDLSRAIAESIDDAAIKGSGTGNEPEGILNTTGIGSVVGGTNGAAPDWDDIVDLESAVANDNADVGSLGYLTNSKVRGKLKKTFVDGSSNAERVWDNRSAGNPLNGYKSGVTNLVPSNLTKGTASGVASAIIFGNFSDLLIGMWGESVNLIVNPYSRDTESIVRISALSFADVAVRHPQSFAAMQDALTV